MNFFQQNFQQKINPALSCKEITLDIMAYNEKGAADAIFQRIYVEGQLNGKQENLWLKIITVGSGPIAHNNLIISEVIGRLADLRDFKKIAIESGFKQITVVFSHTYITEELIWISI